MGVNEMMEANDLEPREQAERRFESSRNALLAVLALTCANIVLAITNADFFFLFSAYIPMDLLYIGAEYSNASGTFAFSALGIIAAFATASIYGIVWLASKKYRVWIIAALVYFVIDTLLSIPWLMDYFSEGVDFSALIEVAFIAWIMYYLITGTMAWYKLRTMPPSDEFEQGEQIIGDVEEKAQQESG